MTRKGLVIIVVALLIRAIASAQPYTVRVTYNTNLRASFGLDAPIVAVAVAGETLTVFGSHDKWLKISRNGREVWMADWVPLTRVGAEQASADINNCCFVDRQCATDQEWTAGYWAYQNQQCGAPAQTQLSTPVSAAADGEVNNCCFTGWQCVKDQDWHRGFYAFQQNRCKHRGLAIEGSDYFVAGIEAALELLQSESSYWYQYAITVLDRIKENNDSHLHGKTFNLTVAHVEVGAHWLAGVIVHDACHAHRTNAGLFRYETPEQKLFEERLCLEVQLEALAMLLPGDSNPFGLRTTLENIHDPAYQWWN